MSQETPIRVIQWATGRVGQAAIRHFARQPRFELAGVLVTSADKVGRDAGVIAGIDEIGVIATDSVDAILAIQADCVHYAPLAADLDSICRILRAGKNVVSPSGYVYPTDYNRADIDRIEAACRAGGTSYHGTGIHPGFAGDILPLVMARLMSRIDRIQVYEYVDFAANPSPWAARLGFGGDPAATRANPSRGEHVVQIFGESMAMLVEGLGKRIERVTTEFDVATATRDLDLPSGRIRAGTVGGMHYDWTGWVDGRPFLRFHQVWTMGEGVEPNWGTGNNQYRLLIEGDPGVSMVFEAPPGQEGDAGLIWTAMNGVHAIPQVCAAAPGLVTHLDLGIVKPSCLFA
ncbi:MAG: hypothetical protein ABIT04_00490 [Novosphingobium sp.]